MKRYAPILAAVTALSVGCGPNISEMRIASAPPRPDNCELQFLQLTVNDLSPMVGTYEMLGSVTLAETGVQDPFQEKYKAIVRPRACAMGGDGVAMMGQATHTSRLGQRGSGVTYAVVRKRQDPSAAPPPPSKF